MLHPMVVVKAFINRVCGPVIVVAAVCIVVKMCVIGMYKTIMIIMIRKRPTRLLRMPCILSHNHIFVFRLDCAFMKKKSSQCGVQNQACRQTTDCCVGGICSNAICVFAVPLTPTTTTTTTCLAEHASCTYDQQCCSNFICNGGRCERPSSSTTTSSCTNTVGALCLTDSDCCGPNLNCDVSGKYCRYG
jgi:hypothetical protein